MKVIVVIWHVFVVLATLIGVGLVSCHYFENTRSHFASYNEAEAAGMFKAGWLPSYMPRSAKDIRESHNIDTNQVSASFSYTPEDTKSVGEVCKLIAETSIAAKYVCPPYEKQTLIIILKADGTAWLESHPSEI